MRSGYCRNCKAPVLLDTLGIVDHDSCPAFRIEVPLRAQPVVKDEREKMTAFKRWQQYVNR